MLLLDTARGGTYLPIPIRSYQKEHRSRMMSKESCWDSPPSSPSSFFLGLPPHYYDKGKKSFDKK